MDYDPTQMQLNEDVQRGYSENGPQLSMDEYLKIARRRKWAFFIPMAIVIAFAAAVALLLPSKYRSSATILIEEQEIPTNFVTATVTSFAEQRLQQIHQRIMSTTKLLEIIDQFDLYKEMRGKRTTEEVIEQMREDVKLKQISTEVMDRRTGRATMATIAFSLAYEGKDAPETVQRVANVLVSLFLQENLQVRERQTAEATQFLDDEMRKVEHELKKVEINLAGFKEQHINELPELLQVNIQGLQNTERNIERLDEQLRSLKEREGYVQTQLSSISPFMENSDRSRLAGLETELVHLQTRFSDEHPDVVKTGAEIAALREKMKMAGNGKDGGMDLNEPDNPAYVTLSSQLAGIRSEVVSIGKQMKEARVHLKRYESRIEATPSVEREYKELSIKQANLQAKFNDLMAKHMEAKVAHGLEKEQKGERFTLIDPPRLPERPFKPNRLAIALVGVVLGIGAGIGWAVLREYSDNSVRNGDKLALSTGFPVLGTIPAIVTANDRRKMKIRRTVSATAVLLIIVAGVTLFHFFVMDLDVFWAKVGRRINML